MATQDIVIRVVYESDLKQGIQEVEALGKAATKDIAVFKSLSKEVGTGVNTALKDAGASARQMADSVTKAGKSGSEFKTLKTQIREAKNEAQLLAAEFGDTSTQAVNAQKKIANLTDELGDFNARVQALNPEAKFKAFGQVAQGAVGGLQGLTGALQIFGSENEEVNKIVQKFQGFINLTQGIESIAGLSDTFKSLGAVLGITTTAQNTLKASTAATAVATEGAAAANTAFAASLSATGIGAIVVALGLLVGAWIAYNNQQDKAIEGFKLFAKNSAEADKAFLSILRNQSNAQTNQIRLLERNLKVLEGSGAEEQKILETRIKLLDTQIAFERSLLKGVKNKEEERKQTELIQDLEDDRLIALANLTTAQKEAAKEARENEIKALEEANRKRQESYANQLALKKQFDEEMAKNPIQTVEAEGFQQSQEYSRKKAATAKQLAEEELARLRKAQGEYEAFEIKRQQDIQQTVAITLQGATDTASALNSLSQQEANNRIATLDNQLNAGLISEQEYAKKVAQIKRRQAEQDKKTALFNAAILIAQAILAANALGPPQSIPAIAFASAIGAIQLAAIAAKPIPQFNKGTLSVPGVYQGKDSVLAHLTPGEAVIPQPMKNAYLPTLQAMFNGTVNPSELNAMVTERRTGRSRAASDNSDLIRAIKAKSSTSIRNAEELARLIGKEISNSYNPRYN
jgi:hypothetical protein